VAALVRSAALTHFAELAAACGLDARALVAAAGLPPRCLGEPDLKVPAHLVGQLLEQAAAQAGEPAFGLRLAESRRLSNLGPLALLVRDEPTLRRALETLMHHIHVHNEAVAVQVDELGGLLVIRTELSADGAGSLRQATELVVGVTCRVLQVLMGAHWQPRLVCFTHAAPPSLALHRRVLGPAVEFGHEFNGIVCNAADLDAPNPGADPVLARYSQRLLQPTLARGASFRGRVRQMIVLLLPRGLCRVDVVAQHLGVDRRTVHRKLAAEGSSFSAIVEAVRRELAQRYVEGTEQPLLDVSGRLGFAAPSAFSRWYRAGFGQSAQRRRAAAVTAASRSAGRTGSRP
jgi:AraC-like DNA-binding protein